MVMLTRKMLRDLWVHKTSFLAIFLLMFMGCYIFSGITSEYNGMRVSLHDFMKEGNMADATIFGNELPSLADMETQEVMLLPGSLQDDETSSLTINVIKENRLSQMKLMEGEPYTPDRKGIWLDERYAKAHHLTVQDRLRFQIGGLSFDEEIVGLVLSVDYIYQTQDNQMVSDHAASGYLYLNADSMPLPFQPNKLLVKSERTDVLSVLQTACASTSSKIMMLEDHPSYSMLNDEINQHKELGMIFSLTFLGIAMLVSVTTVHRLLQTQAMIIGILKALGFHRSRLYLHYCSHCAFIALFAAILGCLLGQFTFSAITYPFMNTLYTLPELNAQPLSVTYLLPLLCMLITIGISLRITHRYLRSTAASILAKTMQRTYQYHPSPKLFAKASFITQWNVRDVLRNRLRSLMSILGVFGCSALLISAFGIYTTMTDFSNWTFQQLETYDCRVNGTFEEPLKQELLRTMQGDEIMNGLVAIKTKEGEQQINLTALSDTRYTHLASNRTTFITLQDGIAVSKNIADTYDMNIGDTLSWRLLGSNEWQSSQVEAIIRSPLTQGITMMKEQLTSRHLPFTTTSIVGNQPEASLLTHQGIDSVQYHEDMLHNIDTMMDATMMMLAVFSIAAVLLGSVILYNLGTLAYMERAYELATLKVLGFQSNSIRKIMIQQNLWLTIIGIIAGIPGGYWLLGFMLTTIQSSMDVMLYLPLSVVLLSSLGTLLLSFLMMIFVSKKIKDIDMVSALKADE